MRRNNQEYELPSYLPQRKRINTSYKYIPKKIFQTWETSEVTEGMHSAVQTWINKNPDWEYYFFDAQARRNFIKDNFSKEVVNAYDQLIPGAYKADLWRYCVLYIHGGIYCDIKQELLTSLNSVLTKDIEFLSFKDRDVYDPRMLRMDKFYTNKKMSSNIYQAFICSKPRHSFLKHAINMIIKNIREGYYGYNPICITGPALLAQAVNICLKQPKYNQIDSGTYDINGFKFTLFPIPNWKEKITYTDKTVPFFKMQYSNYRSELYSNLPQNLEKNYELAWHMHKVFFHRKVLLPKSKFFNDFTHKYKIFRLQFYYCLYRLGIKSYFKQIIKRYTHA